MNKIISINNTDQRMAYRFLCTIAEAAENTDSALNGADFHGSAIGVGGKHAVSIIGFPDGRIARVHCDKIIGNVSAEQFAELKKLAVDFFGEDAVSIADVDETDLEKREYAVFHHYDIDNGWGDGIPTIEFRGCLRVTEEQAAAYILKWDDFQIDSNHLCEHEVRLERLEFHEDDFMDLEAYS